MLRERLNKDLLIFDGGFGSQLQELGMKAGEIPEYYNIEHPKIIIDIHHRYLKAGADFITTNTFGANPLKLEQHKYSYQEVILAAIQNAKEAKKIKPEAYIALDIGPIGKLMEPMGTLTFDEVYQSVKQMVELVKEDIDVVLFETMTDIYELKASILAVKECSDLPVFATMTFETNGRSLSGCDPLTMVNVLEGLKVDALGINCSLGPNEMAPIIENILESTSFPVMIQPNAGLPLLEDGQTVYPMKADEFIEAIVPLVKKGIAIVGGCCGTTPEFIQKLKENCPTTVTPREVSSLTRVSSGTTTVEFGKHVVVCGERLNPTGKKKLKTALKEERYDELVVEAIKQEQAGAHVLDVNVGLPGIDEPKVMKHVIKLLQEVIQLPLQIDSSNFQAIEEACRYYNGKPLINSVNGKDETMEAVFPVVKKYGGVVIGLALDENGIPPKAEQRFEIAKKIINKAKEYGIDKKDIIIDCLVLTASAQQKEVMETIKAVSMVKTLGVHTVLGVSNVSFGLPNRPLLNKTFLAMAMSAGLDLPIINPLDQELMNTIDAFNVLYNYDQDATNYIQKQAQSQVVLPKQTTSFSLNDVVLHGLKDEVKKATELALEKQDGLAIVNEILIPALDQIGKDYETGKIFLPQLIQSANAAQACFDVIKSHISKTSGETVSKGKIIVATVKGDIHDIGKNIVKVLLDNYGYTVVDLGKDVDPQLVVDTAIEQDIKMIGLSALMTTTLKSMEDTIKLVRETKELQNPDGSSKCVIFVGGAVLTEEYAMKIGADYYCRDAKESVDTAKKVLG